MMMMTLAVDGWAVTFGTARTGQAGMALVGMPGRLLGSNSLATPPAITGCVVAPALC